MEYVPWVCYDNGREVVRDAAKAAELYRRAVDAGNATGMVFLGDLYKKGLGVAKHEAKVEELYRRAEVAGMRLEW
jgi:uncharacterized protein